MHFWIDKRNQACGFNNGRLRLPHYIPGSRYGASYCGVYPKPMVTPVHRFQCIESATGRSSGRQNRGPAYYHARFLARTRGENGEHGDDENAISNNAESPVAVNNAPSDQQAINCHRNAINRSTDVISQRDGSTIVPRSNTSAGRLKCGVWAFFATATFFIAGAKFYFYGGNASNEALAFCTILAVLLLVGGSVSLYEAVSRSRTENAYNSRIREQISSEQNETHEDSTQIQVPNEDLTPAELPPPPYHIAIMLPTQQDGSTEPLQIIRRDSPPPTYEKAVT